jgi:hypothetical protein
MCTVSFVCADNKVIITSNRDEEVVRLAIPPQNYLINNKNICFPKDPKAGGTWYAIDENASVLVLLNGAAEKHQWNPPYRRSRGLIVLDLISTDSVIKTWNGIALENVEPFTLVCYQHEQLHQLRWDGTTKQNIPLDATINHIWSSSTLYSKEIREQRAHWFYTFLESKPDVSETDMLHFHRYTETQNQEHGLVINRNGKLKTLSITQSVVEKNKIILLHHDLIEQKEFSTTFMQI